MKILGNKSIIKKIAILILFVMCFSIIMPNISVVNAKTFIEEEENKDKPGGDLLQPIMDFLVFLADSFLNLLQNNFISLQKVVYSPKAPSEGTFSWGWLAVGLAGIGVVAFGVATIATGGAAAVIGGALWAVGGLIATTTTFGKIIDLAEGEFDVPFIMYNPYAIFSGEIPALDINFINPMEKKISSITEAGAKRNLVKRAMKSGDAIWIDGGGTVAFAVDYSDKKYEHEYNENKRIEIDEESIKTFLSEYETTYDAWETEGGKVYLYVEIQKTTVNWLATTPSTEWAIYDITDCLTEEAVSDEIEKNTKEYESSAAILQSSISTWYKVLRQVALVGLLTVLVYIGIRIIITSASTEKAKYKKMFIDWLMAVCMLFVLHYIMAAILTLSTSLSHIFEEAGCYNMVFELPEDTTIEGNKLAEMDQSQLDSLNDNDDVKGYNSEIRVESGKVYWSGEFMGYIRLMAGSKWVRYQLAYGLMYVVLVIYVFTFTFIYLRRALYMAFLTMIAPLIALTYPLDRVKDGQAQAFGLWLREYIFNCLIQPVHLIIYTMTVSTVIELAKDHPVYALVALGFLIPAEKFIRSMFGFEKASTLSPVGSMLGGAAVMGAVQKLRGVGKKKQDKDENKDKDKIRTANKKLEGTELPSFGGENGGAPQNSSQEPDGAQNPLANQNSSQANSPANQNPNQTNQAQNQQSNQPPRQTGQNQTGADQNQAQDSSRWQTFKDTTGKRFRNAATNMGNRGKNRILKAKPLRFGGKLTAKAAGAATIGTFGLAAGISTGDFKNVAKFTGGGMAVGSTLGGNLGERAMDSASKVKENFKEGFYGREEYNNKKLDREYFNGTGFQEMLDNKNLLPDLSGNERARVLRAQIQEYRKAGLTDNKQITSCMKAGLSVTEGSYALKIANNLKRLNLDRAGRDSYREAYRQELAGKAPDIDIDRIWKVIEENL